MTIDFQKSLKSLAEQGEKSFMAGAQWRVLRALGQLESTTSLDIDRFVVYQILHPSRTVEVILPVEFKGKIYICLGMRAWFDNGKLHKKGEIVKGGIRFLSVEEETQGRIISIADEKKARQSALDDVMALGLEMLAKNSGTNFRKRVLEEGGLIKKRRSLKDLDIVGGSKGVIIAPRSLHLPDHNQFVKRALEVFGYKLGLLQIVGWDRDVPAGDIGTTGKVKGSSVLDGFVDGYQKAIKNLGVKMKRNLVVAVLTGKTSDDRYLGNPARATATGFGTVEALKAWAKTKGKKLKDLIVVFDGAGNAARPAATFLVNYGIKVVGMTDSRSVIMVKEGFKPRDLQEIGRIKAKRGSLAQWARGKKGVKAIAEKREDLDKGKVRLWQDSGMNVLFVSSDAMIINNKNVCFLPEGSLVVDGANGPVTPKAEMQLPKRKIDHLTGSFANSGGVIGSLIEWAGNVGNFAVNKKKSEKYIAHCLRSNFEEMNKLVKKGIVDSLADAFYYMAMERYVRKWMR